MTVSIDTFFDGINVGMKYYQHRFKKLGVQSVFLLSTDDLVLISTELPITRYKTALVVERAKELLNNKSHVAKV